MVTTTSRESFETVADRPLRWDERLVSLAADNRVPQGLALRLLAGIGRISWLAGPQREARTRWARWLLGPQAPKEEVRALARRALRQRTIEHLWIHRTALCEAMPTDGLGPLLATLQSGRGALVASAHLAELRCLMLVMGTTGVPFLGVSGVPPSVRLRRAQGMDRYKRRINLRSEELGCRWIGAAGSFPALASHLKGGGCAGMAADVGGSVPALIAGKHVRVSSGAAALAREADVPLFPAFMVVHDRRARMVFEAPLEPRELGPRELQERLIEVLDTYISANLLSWSTPKSLRRTCSS